MNETNDEIPNWLNEMPKTDLHCHLGGSIRLGTMLELADKYNVRLPATDEETLRQRVVFKNRQEKSLAAYLDCISICESVLVAPDAFERVAYEICEDARSENVRLLELRFGPTNYERESMKLYEIVEATLSGLARGSRELGIHTGLIICGIRTDLEATRKAAELAVNYQDSGVVGFDLAGKENGYRPKLFGQVIKPVRSNFLPVTIHAGEDDDVASIAEALIHLNARRIGHGVSLRESTKLMNYIDTTRTGIEICLTSNVDTGSVASMQTHPVRDYYNKGMRVSVNTDNRTISDTNITKEYVALMKQLGFTQHDVHRLAKHGIKSAFLCSETAKALLSKFDEYKKKYTGDGA